MSFGGGDLLDFFLFLKIFYIWQDFSSYSYFQRLWGIFYESVQDFSIDLSLSLPTD